MIDSHVVCENMLHELVLLIGQQDVKKSLALSVCHIHVESAAYCGVVIPE